jgi:DedD protein
MACGLPESNRMATRSAAPDLAVDELKRRARRRLVGAIVLALAAAVILPFLLESNPKPLGDEVTIRIPPIDNGKFINPLAPDKGRDSAAPGPSETKAEPRSGAVIAPKKSITDAERRVLGPSASPSAAQPAPPAASAPAAPPAVPAVAETAPPAGTDTPLAKAEPSIATPSVAVPAPATPTSAYSVQVAAYADAKAATDLAAALKSSGFATYTEAVPTAQGAVQRVRVGPFATRGDADAAVAKLKLAGYDRALVVPNAK